MQLVKNRAHLDAKEVILSDFNKAHHTGKVNDVDEWMRDATLVWCPIVLNAIPEEHLFLFIR